MKNFMEDATLYQVLPSNYHINHRKIYYENKFIGRISHSQIRYILSIFYRRYAKK